MCLCIARRTGTPVHITNTDGDAGGAICPCAEIAGHCWKFMVKSATMSTGRSANPARPEHEAAKLLREAASLAAGGDVAAALEVQRRAQTLLAELSTVRAPRRRAPSVPSAEP